jgi:hypothetical protein
LGNSCACVQLGIALSFPLPHFARDGCRARNPIMTDFWPLEALLEVRCQEF